MKKMKLIAVFAVTLGLIIGPALANYAMAGPQTKCPVMGYKTNETVYADHEGKRVFFCCQDCVGKFKSNPAEYMKKMEAENMEPVPTPAK